MVEAISGFATRGAAVALTTDHGTSAGCLFNGSWSHDGQCPYRSLSRTFAGHHHGCMLTLG